MKSCPKCGYRFIHEGDKTCIICNAPVTGNLDQEGIPVQEWSMEHLKNRLREESERYKELYHWHPFESYKKRADGTAKLLESLEKGITSLDEGRSVYLKAMYDPNVWEEMAGNL